MNNFTIFKSMIRKFNKISNSADSTNTSCRIYWYFSICVTWSTINYSNSRYSSFSLIIVKLMNTNVRITCSRTKTYCIDTWYRICLISVNLEYICCCNTNIIRLTLYKTSINTNSSASRKCYWIIVICIVYYSITCFIEMFFV